MMRILLIMVPLLSSCGDFDLAGSEGFRDGGAIPAADAGGPPPPSGDADPPQEPASDGFPLDEVSREPGDTDYGTIRGCYGRGDGVDDATPQCGDPACAWLRSCCVGSGDCCSPSGASDAETISFASCEMEAAGGLTACLEANEWDLPFFGSAQPRLEGGGLAPGGTEEGDSGLVIREALDAQVERVEISIRFAAPTPCGASCVESAGLGFIDPTQLESNTALRPALALLLALGGTEMRLVIQGEVAASWSVEPDDYSSPWTLITRPSGTVQVKHGEETLTERSLTLPRNLSVVLFGRNRNPLPDQDVTRILEVSPQFRSCDIPTAWTDRQAVEFWSGPATPYMPSRPSHPSLAYAGDERPYLAFSEAVPSGEHIRLARRTSADPSASFALLEADIGAALAPEGDEEALGVMHPDLVWDAASERLWLFYTARSEDGSTRIKRAHWNNEDSSFERSSPMVLHLEPLAQKLEDATVHLAPTGDWLMVVRAEDSAGRRRLATLASLDGATWSEVIGSDLMEILVGATSSEALPQIDFSLTSNSGAYVLHLAELRGARWFIHGLVSHELVAWRRIEEIPRWLDRNREGFDRFFVRQPAADPHEGWMHLTYVGSDGVRDHIGITRRIAPPDTRF